MNLSKRLNELYEKKAELENEINNLKMNPNATPSEIFATRGRLISTIKNILSYPKFMTNTQNEILKLDLKIRTNEQKCQILENNLTVLDRMKAYKESFVNKKDIKIENKNYCSSKYFFELQKELNSETPDLEKITSIRGRYIRSLRKEARRYNEGKTKTMLKEEISLQLKEHKKDLKKRLDTERKNPPVLYQQIPQELGLKLRKIATSIGQLRSAKTSSDKAKASFVVLGNTVSLGLTVAKGPVVLTLDLLQKILPMAGYVILSPAYLYNFLEAKIERSPYDGKKITLKSKKMGAVLEGAMKKVNEFVRKTI